jgi:transcription-repair coupling factor (superfamily II helicase)
LRELQVEMIDRFGCCRRRSKTYVPGDRAETAGHAGGREENRSGTQRWADRVRAGTEGGFGQLVKLIQAQSQVYKLDGKDKLRFIKDLPDAEARAAAVERLLEEIGAG